MYKVIVLLSLIILPLRPTLLCAQEADSTDFLAGISSSSLEEGFREDSAADEDIDPDKVVDPDEQYRLANYCLTPEYPSMYNEALGVKLMKKAADAGHNYACLEYINFLCTGQFGVKKSLSAAEKMAQKAVSMGVGFSDCYDILASEMLEEDSSQTTINKIHGWALKAAKKADFSMLNWEIYRYFTGDKYPLDYDKADQLTDLAVSMGEPEVYECVGYILSSPAHLPACIHMLERGKAKGNDKATWQLRLIYGDESSPCYNDSAFRDCMYNLIAKGRLDAKELLANYLGPQDTLTCHQDFAESYRLSTELANSGDPLYVDDARIRIAESLQHGYGVEKNLTEAINVYRTVLKSHRYNNFKTYPECGIASCYDELNDSVEGFNWYLRLADNGNVCVMKNVGLRYYYGKGVTSNNSQCLTWLGRAAVEGDVEAMYFFTKFFEDYAILDSVFLGRIVDENIRSRAGYGRMAAQVALATCYDRGIFFERDHTEAAKWYQAAIDNEQTEDGDMTETNFREARRDAYINMGLYYFYGDGVEKDFDKSMAYFQALEPLSSLYANFYMAALYNQGDSLHAPNQEKAVECADKALAETKLTKSARNEMLYVKMRALKRLGRNGEAQAIHDELMAKDDPMAHVYANSDEPYLGTDFNAFLDASSEAPTE